MYEKYTDIYHTYYLSYTEKKTVEDDFVSFFKNSSLILQMF